MFYNYCSKRKDLKTFYKEEKINPTFSKFLCIEPESSLYWGKFVDKYCFGFVHYYCLAAFDSNNNLINLISFSQDGYIKMSKLIDVSVVLYKDFVNNFSYKALEDLDSLRNDFLKIIDEDSLYKF